MALASSACQGLPRSTELPAPETGRVLVVGDSLTVGARDFGAFDLPGRLLTVDAEVGRSTAQGIAVLEAADVSTYDLVVLALGTNDYQASAEQMGAWVDRALLAARGTPVVWINVDHATTTLAPAIRLNRALNDARQRHPQLTVANWHGYFNSRPDAPAMRAADGVHYNTAGYRTRAEWMTRVASGTSFIVSADEAGPVGVTVTSSSCGPIEVQLRTPQLNREVATVTSSGEPVLVGETIRGEMLEFYLRSSAGDCRITWTYEIGPQT